MTDTLGVIAASMHADADALRVAAQNIANTGSIAYRRELPLSRVDFASVSASAEPSVAIDLRPGTLKGSADPLHVALEGAGFFVIGTDHGERLTRRGDFRKDANGELVTQAGAPVLGQRGLIKLGIADPVIEADGVIRSGGAIVDRLRIVDVEKAAMLQPAGEGTYAVAPGGAMLETTVSTVRQGFLETSNVQPTQEMLHLMEAMRRFETAQRFARGYDEMLDKAISTLGKV